jgi:hypothetical protein
LKLLKDIRMTDRYTHLMPGRTKMALKKLDRFLKSAQRGKRILGIPKSSPPGAEDRTESGAEPANG